MICRFISMLLPKRPNVTIHHGAVLSLSHGDWTQSIHQHPWRLPISNGTLGAQCVSKSCFRCQWNCWLRCLRRLMLSMAIIDPIGRRLEQQAVVCLLYLPRLTVYQSGLVWLSRKPMLLSVLPTRCWDTLSWPPLGSSTMMLSPSSSLLSSHG